MKRIFSKTFFRVCPIGYIYILIPYLAIIYGLQKIFPFPEVREAIKYPNTICFSFLLGFYGFWRVLRFHPFFKRYLMQLTLSPWQAGKPLPYGPVHLCWIDAIVLTLFILLEILCPVLHWTLPLIAFFAGYNLGLFFSLFMTKQVNHILLYLLFAPFFIYLYSNINITLACLVGLTFFSQWTMYRYFKQFPWNTPWWTENPIEKFKKEALRRRVIRWPFRELCNTKAESNTLTQHVVTVIFVFWWTHTISWFFIHSDPEITPEIIAPYYIIAFIGIPFIRLVAYLVYRPPISLFGRFATGQLIVPGYDKIFIAPIILILVGIFVPGLFSRLGIPELIACELNLSLLLFLAIQLPPSYEKWHYTGQYHIINPQRRTQRNR